MKNFKFDEEPIQPTVTRAGRGKMVNFLVKRGVVQDETQANFLLMGCIIICIAGIAFVYYQNTTNINQVSPTVEEIRLLEEYEAHTRN